MTATFSPSHLQINIFRWVADGTGHAFVEAVAGSGKTTTIEHCFGYVKRGLTFLYMAFNKDIVVSFEKKHGTKYPAMTLNSLGYRIISANVGKLTVRGSKYHFMLDTLLKNEAVPLDKLSSVLAFMKEFVSLSQADGLRPDASDDELRAVLDHYVLDVPKEFSEERAFNMVRAALTQGLLEATKSGIIDFSDQIWVPVVMGWRYRYAVDFLFLDEAQDFSKAKLTLALAALKPGGRCLFVGDRHQSIYGFAGADAHAVQNIVDKLHCTLLPLSISYRCPRSAIAMAQTLVPHIESHENAPEGEFITNVPEAEFLRDVKPGDMVISRVTNPLISAAIKLIRQGKAAVVLGRNIGKQLTDTAKEALGSRPWDELDAALDSYLDSETAAIMKKRDPQPKIVLLQDKVEGVRACAESWRNADGTRITSLAQFADAVKRVFSDGTKDDPIPKGTIVLSSVHRQKGKEAHTVWNIAPEKNFLAWPNQRDWEAEQERNLVYVAWTRTKFSFKSVLTPKRNAS